MTKHVLSSIRRSMTATAAAGLTMALLSAPTLAQSTGGENVKPGGTFNVDCKDLAINSLVAAIQGGVVTAAQVQSCRSDISSIPSGSGNIPILIETALIISGAIEAPASNMHPFLTGQGNWRSHNGVEGQSWIYEAWNVVAVLALLEWAEGPGNDATTAGHCRTWLRAEWAKLALGAVRIPSTMVQFSNGLEATRPRANTWYNGLWAGVGGERMILPSNGTGHNSTAMESNMLGPLLSWALGVGRSYTGNINTNPDQWTWTIWVVNHIHGTTYGNDPGPEAFGLTPTERSNLVALVNNPSATNAQRVLPYLGPFSPRPDFGIIYRRYAGGRLLTVVQKSNNRSKPGVTVIYTETGAQAAFGVGQARALSPSTPMGVMAPISYGRIDEGAARAIAWSTNNVTEDQALPPMSDILWEVAWLRSGTRFSVGAPNCLLADGDADYCAVCGPCQEGESQCADDGECASDLVCQLNGTGGTCVDPDGQPPSCPPLGDPTYCAECGPCGAGEGDCDGNVQCDVGLECMSNVGASYGFTPQTDVCEPSTTTCPWPPGHGHFCRDCGPCGAGQGDCDSADQCLQGLQCSDNVGATYGFPAAVDVCEPAGSGSTANVAVMEVLPSDDSYIVQSLPNQAFDTAELRVQWSGVGNGRYSLLRFHVPSIPGNVLSATLELETQETVVAEAGFYRVSGLTWSEETMTWNSFENQVAAGTASYTWLGSLTNMAPSTVHAFDLGTEVAGGGLYTFGIASGIDAPNQDFWSRESGDVEPRLVIRYLP